MTYVPYDSFLRGVLPFVAGCPELIAIDALRNAAIEFCEQTHWLQYDADAQNGVANVATYWLDCPNDTIITRVSDAWYDCWHLAAKSPDQLSAMSGIEWRTLGGNPRFYTASGDSTQLTLVPYPLVTESLALTAIVTIRPSRNSLTIDQDVYEKWYEVITAGALARLLAMPGQSFTNGTRSAKADQDFRRGIAKAIADRNRGDTRANLVMRPPRFV